jgi:hypothetical protein
MQIIALKFQTPRIWLNFVKVASARITHMSIKDLTLTYTCSREEVALSMNYYGARVVKEEKQR